MKSWEIIFYPEDKDTFKRIESGEKTVESRALTPIDDPKAYYAKIAAGDWINFKCENEAFVKRVKDVRKYPHYLDYFEKEDLEEVMGKGTTKGDAFHKLTSFESYKERLEKYGIVAFELE